MTRRTTIWIAVLSLSAVAFLMTLSAIVLLKVVSHPREPVSGGLPLRDWLPRLDNRSDITSRAAIKEMGTNTLPYLIQTLRQVDSPMRKELVSWLSKHPWLKSKLKLRPPAEISHIRALDAIDWLGPVAKPALPDILPFVTNQDYQLKIRAIFALKSIGPDTQMVSSVMPTLFQALGDREWTMRLAAINALAALHPLPPEVTPTFIRFLDDPSEIVSDEATGWLLAQTNAVVLPRLDKRLHDKDSYVVTTATSQIGVFGAAAAGSEPRLRELLNNPLSTVREAATNALATITGQPLSHSTPDEKAIMQFDFKSLPLQPFLGMYGDMAGKKVAIAETLIDGRITLHMRTVRPLTKSEALQLFDEVLKEQAGLAIIHGQDGSLTAVRTPSEPRN